VNAVVERCPNCGVEHDVSHTGPCEVCGHELRYWCQRHSRDIGWLSGPECAVCQRETEAGRRPPPAPPRPPAPPPAPRRSPERRPSPEPRYEPRAPVERRPPRRVRAEDVLPHVVTGAGLALHLLRAAVVLVRSILLWSFLGAAAGAGYALLVGEDLLWIAGFGLINGAVLGFFLGVLAALATLFRSARRR
jgi:hypothetical protein